MASGPASIPAFPVCFLKNSPSTPPLLLAKLLNPDRRTLAPIHIPIGVDRRLGGLSKIKLTPLKAKHPQLAPGKQKPALLPRNFDFPLAFRKNLVYTGRTLLPHHATTIAGSGRAK